MNKTTPIDKDPLEEYRRRTLRALLSVLGILSLVMLALVLLLPLRTHEPLTYQVKQLMGACVFILAGLGIIALLERFVSYLAAGILFTSLVSIGVLLSDTPQNLTVGESLVYLLLPILVAAILIRPWTAWIVAALFSGYVAVIGIMMHVQVPNIPVIIYFLLVAFIMQQSTQNLERAMRQEIKNSHRLQESQDRYQKITESSANAIITTNMDNIIIDCNTAALKMLGMRSKTELLGINSHSMIHPDTRERLPEITQQLIQTGAYSSNEVTASRMDGSIFLANLSAAVITDWKGNPASLAYTLQDVTEQKQAQEAIKHQNQRIQEVSQQLVNVQEHEKHILAAELHDDLGQSLTSLKLMLDLAARTRSADKRKQITEEAREFVTEIMGKVRNLSFDLRPAMLDDFGLFPALRWLFERIQSQTGVEIRCDNDLISEQRFPPEIETAVFRIIQEALTNVVRHAGVREASVKFEIGKTISFEVRDEGIGFEPEQARQQDGVTGGIPGMQERAHLLGGSVMITSHEGKGTTVKAEIPLKGGKG